MRGGESFLEERFNFSIKHNLLHIKQNKKRAKRFDHNSMLAYYYYYYYHFWDLKEDPYYLMVSLYLTLLIFQFIIALPISFALSRLPFVFHRSFSSACAPGKRFLQFLRRYPRSTRLR